MAEDKEKIVSLEDRLPQLKQARKKRANRRFYMVLALILFLILLIVYLQSPLSHIRSIDVEGNHVIDETEIIELSNLNVDQSFWQMKPGVVSEDIETHPEIEQVTVNRNWYNQVVIHVEELDRVAYQQSDGQFNPILQNGDRLQRVQLDKPREDAPLLHDFEGDQRVSIAQELADMKPSVSRLISEVYYEPNDQDAERIRLFTIDGQEIVATIDQFADKMTAYPSIATQIKEESMDGILHLDVGAYFVPYDASEDEAVDLENES
ncbi:cell division protein FtsQ [Alkalibacillus flavidus]|uniref:Cell division protein DivIB n=1 Tax=Alkalibacillus flavidus TaxID=546021 RepID=A0ABV2KSE4_9BACI